MNVINHTDYVKDELLRMKTYLKNNTEDYYGKESLDWVEVLSDIDGKKTLIKNFYTKLMGKAM